MDFALTDTQLEFRDRARAVAEKLAPGLPGPRDRPGASTRELRREIGAAGLIAPEIPVELGGREPTGSPPGLVTEEIGRGDINVAYLQVVGLAGRADRGGQRRAGGRRALGAEDLQRRGDRRHRAHRAARRAPTRARPRLAAVRDGDDWILNGSKSLSFGRDAAAVVVFARTSDEGRGRGIRAFVYT